MQTVEKIMKNIILVLVLILVFGYETENKKEGKALSLKKHKKSKFITKTSSKEDIKTGVGYKIECKSRI